MSDQSTPSLGYMAGFDPTLDTTKQLELLEHDDLDTNRGLAANVNLSIAAQDILAESDDELILVSLFDNPQVNTRTKRHIIKQNKLKTVLKLYNHYLISSQSKVFIYRHTHDIKNRDLSRIKNKYALDNSIN